MPAGTSTTFPGPLIMSLRFFWRSECRALSKRLGGAHIMMNMETYMNSRPCFARYLSSI